MKDLNFPICPVSRVSTPLPFPADFMKPILQLLSTNLLDLRSKKDCYLLLLKPEDGASSLDRLFMITFKFKEGHSVNKVNFIEKSNIYIYIYIIFLEFFYKCKFCILELDYGKNYFHLIRIFLWLFKMTVIHWTEVCHQIFDGWEVQIMWNLPKNVWYIRRSMFFSKNVY